MGRLPAETKPQDSAKASAFSESERAIPPGVTRDGVGVATHHPLSRPPQRLILRMQSLQGAAPLVVPPLLQLEGHRPLQAVYLSFKSRVPCELPLPPEPVLQAYLILNTSRYRRPRVCTRSTLGSGHLEGPTNGVHCISTEL
jgi:hypothetical protein